MSESPVQIPFDELVRNIERLVEQVVENRAVFFAKNASAQIVVGPTDVSLDEVARALLPLSGVEQVPGRVNRVRAGDNVSLSREGTLASAGSWKDVDVDAFKASLYERRRASTRPRVRL